jgi:Kef-type K+ transport system membrane component KefB
VLTQRIVPVLIVVSGFICLEYFIPIVVGEFLAGIVGELFFGVSDLPWIEFFSHLGLVSLMFLAGFEKE